MSDISDNLKYIYGEDLVKDGQPTRRTMEIEAVVADEFTDLTGRKTTGFSIRFKGAKRMLGVTGATVTRQIRLACGTGDFVAMVGKKITLYPVPSKKSATGWAVRVATGGE